MKYFITWPWWVKFNDMSEPGEIDNSSVVCRHGGVLPRRINSAHNLCFLITPSAWRILHERFVIIYKVIKG